MIKARVVDLNRARPDLTALQLAAAAGCSRGTVYKWAKACGLTVPKPIREHQPPKNRTGRCRARKRAGAILVSFEVTSEQIAALQSMGFLAATDKRSVIAAVSEYFDICIRDDATPAGAEA